MEPGLSSYWGKIDALDTYFMPLMDESKLHVPESKLSETPIYILATAGNNIIYSFPILSSKILPDHYIYRYHIQYMCALLSLNRENHNVLEYINTNENLREY